MPTVPTGFIPALELDRVANGDFLATRDALFKLWDGFNREISRVNPDVAFTGTLAEQPLGLGVNDVGFLFSVTDYNHLVRWDGTAWQWAPGDSGNDYFGLFRVAPTANGWQLCDGTATTRLVVGASLTTAAFTTPTVTAGTFLKILAAYTGTIEAAIAAGISGRTGSETQDNWLITQTAAAGAGADCAFNDFDPSTHDHSAGTLATDTAARPPSLGLLLYYRR